MTLHPAEAARLLVETAEAGGEAAVALVVGASDEAFLGRRLAVRRTPDGGELRVGVADDVDRALEPVLIPVLQDALSDRRAADGLREVAGPDGGALEVYVEIRRPVQELVIVGAGHIAQPLSHLGALLGFRVVVLDDRPDFATRERFPDAHRVLRVDFDHPFAEVTLHERTHIVLVTRGHRYDYPALLAALRAEPAPRYIGMIGSRRRVRATYHQLVEDGIDPAALIRIHAPIGLDLGAETPEEIAVAVAAELVLVRRGGTGRPLRELARVAERFFGGES